MSESKFHIDHIKSYNYVKKRLEEALDNSSFSPLPGPMQVFVTYIHDDDDFQDRVNLHRREILRQMVYGKRSINEIVSLVSGKKVQTFGGTLNEVEGGLDDSIEIVVTHRRYFEMVTETKMVSEIWVEFKKSKDDEKN